MHSQSTISESFLKIFEHLNTRITKLDVKKKRIPALIGLQNDLLELKQHMEKKEATVARDFLKKIAVVFWDKLP